MKMESLDVLCMQEVEVESSFDQSLLRLVDYSLELETNDTKARTTIYIRNGIKYFI